MPRLLSMQHLQGRGQCPRSLPKLYQLPWPGRIPLRQPPLIRSGVRLQFGPTLPFVLVFWLAVGRPEPRAVYNDRAEERRRREQASDPMV
jgi:hypothetical protein